MFTKFITFIFVLIGLVVFSNDSANGAVIETKISTHSKVDDFDTIIQSAYDLYREKRFEESLAKCKIAAELRPKDPRPHFVTGLVYMAKWEMKKASDAFAQAIELAPKEKVFYVSKSQADRFRNARDEAVAAARKAIELDSKYARAYITLGDALSIGAKDYTEVIEAFQRAVELAPNDLFALRELGRFYGYAKNEKGAEEVFRKVMGLDPNKMEGRFDLGRLLVSQGRLKEAREIWNGRTTDKDNTHPNFILVLERAERKLAAETAFAKTPDDPIVLVELGLAIMDGPSWVVDGRQEKAITHFRRALSLKPDLASAQFAICKALVQQADTNGSKNPQLDLELEKLRTMDPRLANELIEYRRTYSGGLRTIAPK